MFNTIRKYNYLKRFPYPETYMIEPVYGCNFQCPECAVGGGEMSDRRSEKLPYGNFVKIFDKIQPYAKYLYLVLWGEPFMNARFLDMCKYAKNSSPNIQIVSSTNGSIMSPTIAERAVTSGLGVLVFSIDGTTQEVYEKYRVGGKLSLVMKNLELFVAENRRHGNKVTVVPQFIAFKHNEHQIDDFKKYCAAIGLECVIKAPYVRTGSVFMKSDIPEYHRESYNNETELKKAMSRCSATESELTICADGTIVPCCNTSDNSLNFGNLLEEDLKTIWDSEEYREFRWDLKRRRTPQYCLDKCLTYFKEEHYQ